MPIQTQTADGITHEFPDGTDRTVIDRAMKNYTTQKMPAEPAVLPGPSQPQPAEGFIGRGVGALKPVVQNLWDSLLAGEQGVATYAADQAKLAPQSEQFLFSETGKVRDPNKYFVGREPKTGKMAVYLRTPETEATAGERLAQFGRPVAQGAIPETFPGAAGTALRTPSASQKLLQDFKTMEVRPTVPAVGQGRAAGLTAQVGRTLPLSPVAPAITQSVEQTARAAERAAAGFGAAETAEDAGNVAQNALRRFAADTSQAEQEFNRFYGTMQGAPPTAMTNTVKLLRELKGKYPSAPELEGLFTDPKIIRLAESLEPRTVTIPQKTSPILGPTGQPVITAAARTVQRGGTLTMPELRGLRSNIGHMLENPQFGPGSIPKGELRRLYAAFTQDMQEAARLRGPDAVQALQRATLNYGVRMRSIEQLRGVAQGKSPEVVFRTLNNAARGGDAGLLQTAKRVMSPQEWGDIGATIVRQIGKPAPGAKDVLQNADFSVSTFMTNWNKLSAHAKDLLFGADVPGAPRAGLEALARVVQAQKNVARLANTSHTAEYQKIATMIETATATIMAGRFPVATGAGLTGAYGLSWLLMNPRFTSWLYTLPDIARSTRSPSAMAARAVDTLAAMLRQPTANAPAAQSVPQSVTPSPPQVRPNREHETTPPP